MKKKVAGAICLSILSALAMAVPALAAGWEKDSFGWKWENADGTYAKNSWVWDDWNKDGSQECYYFGDDGYMLSNTVTPDGYFVDQSGAWYVPGQAYMNIYNTALSDPDRYPSVTTDVDRNWFLTSRQKLDFIDRGLYYELPDVKITVTKKLDLGLIAGKKVGDHITLEGVEYAVTKVFEDGGCAITPISYGNNLKTWEWIDVCGDYCAAVESNDYTLQEVLYNGNLYFSKDAVIRDFLYQGFPYTFTEITIPEIIDMTEDGEKELAYPVNYLYGKMSLDKNGLVTRFEQFYTP